MKRAVKITLFLLVGTVLAGLIALLSSTFLVGRTVPGMPHTSSDLTVQPIYASPRGAIVASTLIESEDEVILVDSQYILSEAAKVAEAIKATGKSLKLIWITHPHPDHFLGLQAVLDEFPGTPVYATPEVVADIGPRVENFIAGAKRNYGEDAADTAIIPEAYEDNTLELGGQPIKIFQLQGDAAHTGVLYIPSIDTVVAADVVYWGTHLFMIEALSPEAQDAWYQSLEFIRTLNPDLVVPGHKMPNLDLADSLDGLDAVEDYLDTFAEVLETEDTPEAAIAALSAAYPDYGLPFILNLSVNAAYQTTSSL